MRYKSCSRIHNGFNFYRSGKITACCNQISPELELAHVDDENLAEKLLVNHRRLLMRHKLGDAPEVCRKCSAFVEHDWDDAPGRVPFSQASLNHYKKCNLKCVHCGYRRQDEMEHDTPHEKVFDALLKCIAAGIMVPMPYLEIGGGEPSLGNGIENIVQYALEHGWEGLINSNGARFSQVFADGVNAAQFSLLLTPDAGSRETYARIKGADNFDNAWRNIGRYMAATSGKALVKFILEEGNKNDIPAMIATAKNYGVQTLVLSLDMNVPAGKHPEYVARAKEFLHLARKNGMTVIRGAFLPEF